MNNSFDFWRPQGVGVAYSPQTGSHLGVKSLWHHPKPRLKNMSIALVEGHDRNLKRWVSKNGDRIIKTKYGEIQTKIALGEIGLNKNGLHVFFRNGFARLWTQRVMAKVFASHASKACKTPTPIPHVFYHPILGLQAFLKLYKGCNVASTWALRAKVLCTARTSAPGVGSWDYDGLRK